MARHFRPLTSEPIFFLIVIVLICLFVAQLILVSYHEDAAPSTVPKVRPITEPPHLLPHFAPLPPFSPIENGEGLKTATLNGKPTVAGIAFILQQFLSGLHETQKILAKETATRDAVIESYVGLAKKHLMPLEEKYRGRSIFPIREDDSIFVSIASFRDHLLGQTLKSMFQEAANPDKLYVGVVVQNCFGVDYTCKTGAQVIGKNAQGRDMTKVSDAPPDKNGVAEFCEDDQFQKYCTAGHIRALYVNETEAIGPAAARHWGSKLWGGETYFVQIDSHLHFAKHWDAKYVQEARATKSYPKIVLSSYPPGFGGSEKVVESPGARLCSCEFSTSDIEHQIIRINTGSSYKDGAQAPTQIPFIAAGFFFTRAEFLTDVPFDPMLPWTFMGEEIALSMRAWTNGWDIYAPRKNLIAHQYRPGRMGLPKFWGSVGRTYGRGRAFYHKIQDEVIERVKHMVGYPESTREIIEAQHNAHVLTEIEHYGLGQVRSREAFIDLVKLDMVNKQCHNLKWCNQGELL